MHRLDAPTGFHKSIRQPVQQFRMRGFLSSRSKIVRSLYQPLAKMILPDPIHHHASRQRVRRISQPLRQLQTAAAGVWRHLLSTENFQPSPRHFITRLFRIASQMHPHIRNGSLGDAIRSFTSWRVGHVLRAFCEKLSLQHIRLRHLLNSGRHVSDIMIDSPADSVRTAWMSIRYATANQNFALDGTHPTQSHRSILRRMNKKIFRWQRRPDLQRLIGRINKDRWIVTCPPDMQPGCSGRILYRFGQQARTTATIQKQPRGRIAITIRVRVSKGKIGDDILRQIPNAFLPTDLGNFQLD